MAAARGRSEPGLDVLRAIAIAWMIAVHVRRLLPPTPAGGAARLALDTLARGEPWVAAAFALLAGASVVLALGAGRTLAWLAQRAAVLWLLSVGLFVAQYGLALPDLVLSSGILSALAVSTLVVGAALRAPSPRFALAVALGATLALAWALERAAVGWSGVDGGPGGAVPLLAFAILGALAATGEPLRRPRRAALGALAAAPLALGAAALGLRLTTTRTSWYPRVDTVAAFEIFSPGYFDRDAVPLAFWNHSVAGVVVLAPLLLAPLALALRGREVARTVGVLRVSALLGRHALFVYVAHLAALGVASGFGLAPRDAVEAWGAWGALLALAWAGAWGLERLAPRRAQSFSEAR
ncbi:MAG: DUF1624 domain-containing protein [Polyangiaceae bacterium]|nr:DUF1624 domain-containing protein [Polyangiaceae bacterium]